MRGRVWQECTFSISIFFLHTDNAFEKKFFLLLVLLSPRITGFYLGGRRGMRRFELKYSFKSGKNSDANVRIQGEA